MIGRDTRESGPVLEAAVAAGLRPLVARAGVASVWCPRRRWRGWPPSAGVPAAMITASHNPWQDNGVKIFAPGGVKLPDSVERAIEALLDADRSAPPGVVPSHSDSLGEYVDHLVSMGTRRSLG